MNSRLVVPVAVLILSFCLTGCAPTRTIETPIPHRDFYVEKSNSTLVVLLPGRGDDLGLFLGNGTVDQIRTCNPEANIVGVDAHLGYYTRRRLVGALRDDIVGPALETNVERVWLMGVSLGGMGSLIYRRVHPSDLEGVILMAPYLGEWEKLKKFRQDSGTVDPSIPPPFRLLWRHIVSSLDSGPPVTLAFGKDDRYVRQQEWLAGYLDEKQVIRRPGGHYWSVWTKLWPRAMKASELCER